MKLHVIEQPGHSFISCPALGDSVQVDSVINIELHIKDDGNLRASLIFHHYRQGVDKWRVIIGHSTPLIDMTEVMDDDPVPSELDVVSSQVTENHRVDMLLKSILKAVFNAVNRGRDRPCNIVVIKDNTDPTYLREVNDIFAREFFPWREKFEIKGKTYRFDPRPDVLKVIEV